MADKSFDGEAREKISASLLPKAIKYFMFLGSKEIYFKKIIKKYMNTKIKLIMGLFVFFGLAFSAPFAHAQYVPGPVVSYTSATIYGYVTPNGSPTEAWFEWGTSSSLGNRTPSQTFNYNSQYSFTLTGLSEGTTYYYQAKASNTFGVASGEIKSFTTLTHPITQTPTVTLTANPASIQYGGNSTLTWSSANTTYCNSSWTTNNATNGSALVYPTATTTYYITCTGAGGTANASTTVTVASYPSPTVTLRVDNNNLTSGGSTYVRWTTTGNPTSCVASGGANGWAGVKSTTSGSFYTGSLYSTTTYNITCSNSSGSSSDVVTVNVNSINIPQAPTVSLIANPSNIQYGGSSTLSWNSSGATSCNATWTTSNTTSGYRTVSPTATTTYSITCTGEGGSTTDTTTVTVGQQNIAPTVKISASNTNVNYGSSTYVNWTSTNASSCTANGGANNWAGTKDLSGNFYTGSLNNTTTYSITCSNNAGLSATDSVTVNVGGQNATLNVNTNGATNLGMNYATLNGYLSSSGTSNIYAWFEWGTSSYYGNQTGQVNYGSNTGTSYSYYLSGLSPNTTYYYRAVAQANNGQLIYGSQMSFTTLNNYNNNYCSYNNCYFNYNNQPLVTTYSATGVSNTYAILNGYVDPNGSYAMRWFEWGTNYSFLYTSTNRMSQGTYAGNFSETLYNLTPNTVYYFRAAALGGNGATVYGNTLTFITTNYGSNTNTCTYGNCAPTAVTTSATSIGSDSARISGLGLVSNSAYTTGYFEYGTTSSLGRSTENKNIGNTQSNPFYENLYNLSPNTTYYYRAVVTNQYGTARGDILSFTTSGGNINSNTNTNTVYRNTTVVTNTTTTNGTSKSSLVFLTINKNNESIRRGDVIQYVVNYKNVSSKSLSDVVLQVYIPKELEFIEASRGSFSSLNNILLSNIGNLNPGEEGSVMISVKVTSDAQIGKITVVTANMAYTVSSTGSQEEVFAYSKNTIEGGTESGQLGALALLFGNSFLPNNLIGWLLLILLLVLLILTARKAYYGPRTAVATSIDKSHH